MYTNFLKQDKKGYLLFECLECGKVFGVKPELWCEGNKHSDYQECIPLPDRNEFEIGNKVKSSANTPGEYNHKYRHGRSNRSGSSEPVYAIWCNMYRVGRCKRWESFDRFLEDVGEKPEESTGLKRIDRLDNWNPDNVYWGK